MGIGPRGASALSFSGRERNALVASDCGKRFVNLSYFSGADSDLDGRVAARADLDHDGDEDLIVVSRNKPILTVYLNQLDGGDFVALSFEDQPIGATVWLECGDRTIRRDVLGGEGFGTQSSRTLTVGLGDCATIDELRVRYPTGESASYTELPSGLAYRLRPKEVPQRIDGYVRASKPATPKVAATMPSTDWLVDAPYVYVTLWASWCTACKNAQPRLEAINRRYPVVALSVEPSDGDDVVAAYRATYHPTYMLRGYDAKIVAAVSAVLGSHPPLPSGIFVERKTGRVEWSGSGVATLSDLGRRTTTVPRPTRDMPWVPIGGGALIVVTLSWFVTRRRNS